MTRTVNIRFSDGFAGPVSPELERAIGYAVTWARESAERYAGRVAIFVDSRGQVRAQYHDSQDRPTFYMEGIPDGEGGRYSFHS